MIRRTSRHRLGAVLAIVLACTASSAGASASDKRSGFHTPSRSGAWCAGAESWQSARRSSGRVPVHVKARVASITYARSSRGQPTFIDLGAAYPAPSRLTLVIWGRNRVNFPNRPELMFRPGQAVCAQGFVYRYRGIAQIEVALWDSRGRLSLVLRLRQQGSRSCSASRRKQIERCKRTASKRSP